MTAEQEQNEDLIRRYYNATIEELLELNDELIAEDFTMHDPLMPEPVHGRDGLNEYYRSFETAFSDIRLESEDIMAAGDQVAVRWTIRGTHDKGEFMGVRPTDTEFEISGIDINRIEDEQIVETWSQYDSLGFMQALGIIPDAPIETGATADELVERMVEAENSHDADQIAALVAEDYHSEAPAHPERTITDREHLRETWQAVFESTPDLEADLLRYAVSDNTLWTEWYMHDTQTDGSELEMRGVAIQGFEDGLLQWGRIYMEPVEQAEGETWEELYSVEDETA